MRVTRSREKSYALSAPCNCLLTNLRTDAVQTDGKDFATVPNIYADSWNVVKVYKGDVSAAFMVPCVCPEFWPSHPVTDAKHLQVARYDEDPRDIHKCFWQRNEKILKTAPQVARLALYTECTRVAPYRCSLCQACACGRHSDAGSGPTGTVGDSTHRDRDRRTPAPPRDSKRLS
jgi:hypothetical protein